MNSCDRSYNGCERKRKERNYNVELTFSCNQEKYLMDHREEDEEKENIDGWKSKN